MNPFAHLRSRIARNEEERGAIIVLTAMVMLLLLFIAAFATDLGAWYRQGEEQQRAADVGSLNGIATFDRVAKENFPVGETRWEDLTPGEQFVAEDAGIREAAAQIQALLETSGLTFTTTPASFSIAAVIDPNPPQPGFANHESTAILTADDGSIITITRGWRNTGVGLDGVTPVFVRVIEVSIDRDGEQFFSNILRDAPTITRAAESILSDCGAVCDNEVEFNPPFVGFKGTGNGDGYGPLLFDRDGDGEFDEAWAVNHHSNGANKGQIICVQFPESTTDDAEPCPGAPAANDAWDLDFQTGNRPVEYIDKATGKIYFAARLGTDSFGETAQSLGLACFDARAQQNCTNPFISFWTQTTGTNYPAWINATGPFEFDDRLYIVSQSGQVACATLDLNPCTVSGPGNVPGTNTSFLPGLNAGNVVSNGEQNGSTLILTQNGADGVLFRCLDLSNGSGAVTSCGQHWEPGFGNGGDDNLTFTRFNTAGAPVGVCVLHIQNGKNHCVDWTASSQGAIAGLSADLAPIGNSWGGDTFTWQDPGSNRTRTFFAGGNSNRVGCWDWNSNDSCVNPDDGSAIPFLQTNNAATDGNGNALPYSFDQISDRCILGLGHKAVFFSFNPLTFGPCVDVKITTDIEPCLCEDANAGARWGAITIPDGLIGSVTFLEASIVLPDGTDFVFPDGSTTLDVIANGGDIDLSELNDSPTFIPQVELTLDADSALTAAGDVVFQDGFIANLEISINPTLSE